MRPRLYVAKSTIPNAGFGVFTKKSIPTGQIVAQYRGERMTADSHTDHRYCCELTPKIHINARNQKYGSLGPYINDPRSLGSGSKTKRTANVRFVRRRGGKIVLASIRSISPREELLVDYGSGYVF